MGYLDSSSDSNLGSTRYLPEEGEIPIEARVGHWDMRDIRPHSCMIVIRDSLYFL